MEKSENNGMEGKEMQWNGLKLHKMIFIEILRFHFSSWIRSLKKFQVKLSFVSQNQGCLLRPSEYQLE